MNYYSAREHRHLFIASCLAANAITANELLVMTSQGLNVFIISSTHLFWEHQLPWASVESNVSRLVVVVFNRFPNPRGSIAGFGCISP